MTCRTCDCADKAADTDEWVTFAKRPVEARLTAERDALQVGRDRDRVKGATVVLNEELRTSEQEARARRAEAEVTRLTAERDALAAQVARVEKLAEWFDSVQAEHLSQDDCQCEMKDCYECGPWHACTHNGPPGRAWQIRAALAGSEADTSDVDVCSGDADCTSALHVHGCFADLAGPCTNPDEHQPTDQEADRG